MPVPSEIIDSRTVRIARAIIAITASIEGLWMAFDGTRALTVGDYVTPRTGPRAGELGPWHYLVESVGIAPRSMMMKIIFVAFGVAWLVIAAAMVRRTSWAARATFVAAVLTLWYLPVGTACSLIQIVSLLFMRRALLLRKPARALIKDT